MAADSGAEIFVPEEPQLRALFDRAEDFIRKKTWSSAAELLARISINTLPGPDPELEEPSTPVRGAEKRPAVKQPEGGSPREEKLKVSASSVISSGAGLSVGAPIAVRKFLERLPREEQKRWRDLVEPVLSERWEASHGPLTPEERQPLRRRIIRDYPDSSLYLDAVEEEIDEALESGEVSRALSACRSLLARGKEPPAPARLRAAVLGARLAALSGSGEPLQGFRSAAEAILSSEEASLDRGAAARAKKEIEAAAAAVKRQETAKQGAAPEKAGHEAAAKAEPVEKSGGFELGSVVWRSVLADRELRRWAQELTDPRRGGEGPVAREIALPFFPVAWGDLLLFQNFRKVVALGLPDLDERWSHALPGPPGELIDAVCAPAIGPGLVVVTQGDRVLALNPEDGALLWDHALSYDRARRKLLIHPPGEEPPAPAPPAPPPEPAEDKKEKDQEKEEEAGPKEAAESKPEERAASAKQEARPVVLLSSPVLWGEAVLFTASVRIQDEVQLFSVSLGRGGGKRWVTKIGSFRSGDYLGQVAAVAPPTVRSPLVFVPTNLGLIGAVDLADGSIQWLRRYPRLHAAGRAESVRSRHRWSLNPLHHWSGPAGGDLVLCASQDTNLLLALSPDDGALLWEIPRDEHSSIIGADAGRVYLGGPAVSAVELQGRAAGATAWRWNPPAPSFALGRGTMAEGRLLVSQNETLVELDLATGRPLSTSLWDFRGGGGNLLLWRGFLAAAGAGELLVYDREDRARERASRLPEEERLLEVAKLDLKRGDLTAAFAAFGSWAELKPVDPPANSPLYRLRFELAEIAGHWLERRPGSGELPENATPALQRYRVLLEPLPERKVVAAIQAAASRRAAGDNLGAIGFLEEALKLEVPPVPYPVNDFLNIPSGDAIRDEIAAIRDSPTGKAAFRRFEDRAEEVLRDARRIGTQPAFRRVIDGFPFTRAEGAARRELADYLLNQQNPGEAIRCLQELLRDHPEMEDYAAVKMRVADLLMESHRFSEAREVLLSLLKERPEAMVEEQVTARQGREKARRQATVREVASRRISEPPLRDVDRPEEPDVPALRFPLRKRWRSPANLAASSRFFLRPEGKRPESLAGTFFTRSREVIECRQLSDGYPRWTVELGLIPGFAGSAGSGAGFFFAAPPRLSARFCEELLVVQDPHNLLSIDTHTGRVLWHRPFGQTEEAAAAAPLPRIGPTPSAPAAGRGRILPAPPEPEEKGRGRIQRLSETVRGVAAGPGGIFVTTSQGSLLAFNLDGTLRWERALEFEPAADAPPELTGSGELAVFQEAPVAVHFLEAASGKTLERLEVRSGADARFVQRPLLRADRLAILAMPDGLEVVNLTTRKIRGSYREPGVIIQKAWSFFPDLPDQALLHIRTHGLPALVGVDIDSGRELWRYDRFPASRSEISVHADGTRLYVVHGEDRWNLLALDLRASPERGRYFPLTLWPSELQVGTFFSRESERQVLISQDAVFVPDPGASSVMVYDKLKGSNKISMASPITRFLIDKRYRFAMDIVEGLLVILTEGGDACFEATPSPSDPGDPSLKTRLVKRYLAKQDDWDNVAKLAGRFFIDGEEETAITLLDRALLSEGLPSLDSPGRYQYLSYLLAGIKEEAMKDQAVTVACRRFRSPPTIDGELNDFWNYTTRMEMKSLRNVGLIPAPGQAADTWVGEEDLSATLYTGWDDENFYFALDVEDSQIFPYDKGADFWKGDCLIIGIDPTGDGGYYQKGNDQLLTLALTVPKRKPPGKGGKKDEEDEDEDHKPKGLFSVKKKDDNSGVVYEVALPWSSFEGEDGTPQRPAPGMRFGLSLLLTDDDTGQGAQKTLSLNPCHLLPRDPKRIWRFLIPQYFPKVVLE